MVCSIEKLFDTVVILAGGKSSRMGFDKQEIFLNGEYLIVRTVRELSDCFNDIVIVSNKPDFIEGLTFNCPVTVVSDEYVDCGPLGGIHAGLKHAKSEYAYVFACDMPNINKVFLKYLGNLVLGNIGVEAIVGLNDDKVEPFNSVYATSLVPEISAYLKSGGRSLHRFIRPRKPMFLSEELLRQYSSKLDMLYNVNTVEDLKMLGDGSNDCKQKDTGS